MSQQKMNPELLKQKLIAYGKARDELASKARTLSDGIVTVKINPALLHDPNVSEEQKQQENAWILHYATFKKAWDEQNLDLTGLSEDDIMAIKLQFVMQCADRLNQKLQQQAAQDLKNLQQKFGLNNLA